MSKFTISLVSAAIALCLAQCWGAKASRWVGGDLEHLRATQAVTARPVAPPSHSGQPFNLTVSDKPEGAPLAVTSVATPAPDAGSRQRPTAILDSGPATERGLQAPSTTSTATLSHRPPQITAFSVETMHGPAGDSILLAWEAVGEQAAVCPTIDAHWVGCRCLYDVPLVGTQLIEPDEVIGRYSGFELVVDSADRCVTRTVDLSVSCPAHAPSWFFPSPPQMCPGGPVLRARAAAQRFERGLMIWLSEQDTYYILYDSFWPPSGGTVYSATQTSLQIVRSPLDLKPGSSSDHRVGEIAPEGLAEPVSGFGLVWRGEVRGVEDVRKRLGWALDREAGYVGAYQCEASCGSYASCYLLGPEGTIFRLRYEGQPGYVWEAWYRQYE